MLCQDSERGLSHSSLCPFLAQVPFLSCYPLQLRTFHYFRNYGTCFSDCSPSLIKSWIVPVCYYHRIYPQPVLQRQLHSRCSINTCWINVWYVTSVVFYSWILQLLYLWCKFHAYYIYYFRELDSTTSLDLILSPFLCTWPLPYAGSQMYIFCCCQFSGILSPLVSLEKICFSLKPVSSIPTYSEISWPNLAWLITLSSVLYSWPHYAMSVIDSLHCNQVQSITKLSVFH